MNNVDEIKPIFNINEEEKSLIQTIEKKLKEINIDDTNRKNIMRKKSRIISVYSSLAIEANSLSLEEVSKIIEEKPVLGKRREIQEVKNANELYERINEFNWRSEIDFLKTHLIMMKYFEDDNGGYRNHGEGIKSGNKVIFTAPNSILVNSLMKSLFKYINDNENKIHPLVLVSIFHYYFVYIHPFTDGNGRMARFWVSLMLIDYNCNFEYLPIEEEIHLSQKDYYSSISKCHINGNANEFIYFMLKTVNRLLDKTTQKTTQIKLNNNQNEIITLIKSNPTITRK